MKKINEEQGISAGNATYLFDHFMKGQLGNTRFVIISTVASVTDIPNFLLHF